jgi:hypothetical protein
MTTKAPSPVKAYAEGSTEAIAYASVKSVPTVDPHDQDRLGYNVWRWMALRKDSLDLAVRSAGSRMLVSEEEATRRIRQYLQEHGVTLD